MVVKRLRGKPVKSSKRGVDTAVDTPGQHVCRRSIFTDKENLTLRSLFYSDAYQKT